MASTTPPIFDYRAPEREPRRWLGSFDAETAKLAMLAAVYFAAGSLFDWDWGSFWSLVGVIIWLSVAAAAVLRRLPSLRTMSSERMSHRNWRRARLALGLVSLALLLPVSHRSCPHGQSWHNAQLGIYYSYGGQPCRNGPQATAFIVPLGGRWHLFLRG